MKPSPPHLWKPDSQLLAAYFDGELDERPELADLRDRLEAWLEQHPEALTVGDDIERLKTLCLDTASPEPCRAVWNNTLQRIRDGVRQSVLRAPSRHRSLKASACAVGIVLLLGSVFAAFRFSLPSRPVESVEPSVVRDKPPLKPIESLEIFPVATADEVVILRVEGADTAALVVGELPLDGPMELASPGEIRVVNMRPDERDRMLPRAHLYGPNRPMIWAYLGNEKE